MQLNINGKTYNLDQSDLNRKLLWILRDDLALIGTRYGCGAGFCGACTVHINGRPTRSCITPLSAIAPEDWRKMVIYILYSKHLLNYKYLNVGGVCLDR